MSSATDPTDTVPASPRLDLVRDRRGRADVFPYLLFHLGADDRGVLRRISEVVHGMLLFSVPIALRFSVITWRSACVRANLGTLERKGSNRRTVQARDG